MDLKKAIFGAEYRGGESIITVAIDAIKYEAEILQLLGITVL